ncbi:MAG: GNAT family N-acetyltransferase [Micrococcaceae bacterium]
MVKDTIYPAALRKEVVLKDGSAVIIRPIVPADIQGLQKFHSRQSKRSIYLRFFTYREKISVKDLIHFTWLDYKDRMAFVALRGGDIIGIARYDRLDDTNNAEIAFNVADAYQGRGMSQLFLEELAKVALDNSITTFEADLLPENDAMIRVFKNSGFKYEKEMRDGLLHISFGIEPTNESEQKKYERAVAATVNGVKAFLEPKNVAIIGASRDKGSLGGKLAYQVVESNFDGPIFTVNSEAIELAGNKNYTTIKDVPVSVDVALIAVPNESVFEVIRECGQAGVKAAVIYTAGFDEWELESTKGRSKAAQLQQRIVKEAKKYGLRIVGPASLGFINNTRKHKLNASFAMAEFNHEKFGLATQSYAMGISIYQRMISRNFGFSTMVSTGNTVDITAIDLIRYWENSLRCKVGAFYLESLDSLAGLGRAVKEFTANKKQLVIGVVPLQDILIGKIPYPRKLISEFLHNAGAITTTNSDKMLNVSAVLARQKLPKGGSVAIVTNFPGVARIAAHAVNKFGLDIIKKLEIPMHKGNEHFVKNVEQLVNDENIGAVICFIVPTVEIVEEELLHAVENVMRKDTLTIAVSGTNPWNFKNAFKKINILPDIETALETVMILMEKVKYNKLADELVVPPAVYLSKAKKLFAEFDYLVKDKLRPLKHLDALKLMDIYELTLLPKVNFIKTDQGVKAAKIMEYPVTVQPKNSAKRSFNNTEYVKDNLGDATALKAAVKDLHYTFKHDDINTFEVRKTPKVGFTCTLEIIEDEYIGDYLVFNLESKSLVQDESKGYRILPLNKADLEGFLVEELKGIKIPYQLGKLKLFIVRVCQLKADFPEIRYLKLSPIVVSENDVECVLAEILVQK